jgi:hypothetical protein
METWVEDWINLPAIDQEERLPDTWTRVEPGPLQAGSATALWGETSSLWNMKGRPAGVLVRFHDKGIEAAVTWAVYIRRERDPSVSSTWIRYLGAFPREFFLRTIRARLRKVSPVRKLSGPELAALAHSLVLHALIFSPRRPLERPASSVPAALRTFLRVDEGS